MASTPVSAKKSPASIVGKRAKTKSATTASAADGQPSANLCRVCQTQKTAAFAESRLPSSLIDERHQPSASSKASTGVSAAAAPLAPVQPAASAYDPRRYESAASAPLPARSREPTDAAKAEPKGRRSASAALPPSFASETCNAAPLPTRDSSPRLRGKRHFASEHSASLSADHLPSDIGALPARRRAMLSRSWSARHGSSATLAGAMSGYCPTIRHDAPSPIVAPAMRHSGLVLLPQQHAPASADLASTYDHDYVAPSAQRAPEHIVQHRARMAALDAANAAVGLACARERGPSLSRQPLALVETDAAIRVLEPSECSTASHSALSSARSFGKGAAKTAAIKPNAARSRGAARRK